MPVALWKRRTAGDRSLIRCVLNSRLRLHPDTTLVSTPVPFNSQWGRRDIGDPPFYLYYVGCGLSNEQLMKYIMVTLVGALIWFTMLSIHWLLAMLLVVAPMVAVLVWRRPEHALYGFFVLVVMLTDAMAEEVDGIFAIKDVKIVQGLPPLLITFFLAMSLLYIFKFYLLDRKQSVIPAKYGAVLMLILL